VGKDHLFIGCLFYFFLPRQYFCHSGKCFNATGRFFIARFVIEQFKGFEKTHAPLLCDSSMAWLTSANCLLSLAFSLCSISRRMAFTGFPCTSLRASSTISFHPAFPMMRAISASMRAE
jgi:hypothetical protein